MSDHPPLRAPIIPAFGVLELTVHGNSQVACHARALDLAEQYFTIGDRRYVLPDEYEPMTPLGGRAPQPLRLLERTSSPVLIDGVCVAYRARFAAWLAYSSVTS